MLCRVLGWSSLVALSLIATGCRSPYHSDQGALFGGLTGAGLGAIIGNQSGDAGAGAAIGAAAGALTGAVVGDTLDDMEARNRAIAAQIGRPVAPGAVTIDDVVSMSRAGVAEELIVNHIRANGSAVVLKADDLIFLQQQGVSPRVIQALQTPPVRPVVYGPPAPVIVEEHYYDPWWGPPYYYPRHRYGYRHCRPRHGVSWGVSVSN